MTMLFALERPHFGQLAVKTAGEKQAGIGQHTLFIPIPASFHPEGNSPDEGANPQKMLVGTR
jgi:hypothetical protein